MPHGHCYLWKPSLVWTMAISDLSIGVAYIAISLSLYALVKRVKLPFSAMFLAFGVFILTCGATHLMEVYTLWTPAYWLAALIKIITALASLTTAILMFPVRAQAIRLVEKARISDQQQGELAEKARVTSTYFETLQSTEAKFRGLLESAPDGIVVVGIDAKILIVNSQTEQLFGYHRDELIGQPIEILVPEKYRNAHIGHRTGYITQPRTRPMGAGQSLTGRKKDGREFPIEISLSPVNTEKGVLITSIIRDITERRQAEEHLQSALREKEALLKEIHHRVKNNLQVTSSLLKLQSEYIADPRARELMAESQHRIRSMALVHEKLYRSSDLSRINFSEYLETLAQLLFGSFGIDSHRIRLNTGRDPVFLSVEPAVPCGLIVNELLSNCLKHAFPQGASGEISVSIEKAEPGVIAIRIADNGVGLPKDIDVEKTETLGLQLVRTLVKQLDGQLKLETTRGTEFIVTFPETRGVAA